MPRLRGSVFSELELYNWSIRLSTACSTAFLVRIHFTTPLVVNRRHMINRLGSLLKMAWAHSRDRTMISTALQENLQRRINSRSSFIFTISSCRTAYLTCVDSFGPDSSSTCSSAIRPLSSQLLSLILVRPALELLVSFCSDTLFWFLLPRCLQCQQHSHCYYFDYCYFDYYYSQWI